jgi:tetratricopeptide (TPR) repeat protein
VLDRAAALQPSHADLHANRGWALELLGRLTEARAAYAEALKRESGHVRSLGALAALSARVGDAGEARRLAGEALRQSPDDVAARLALAMAEVGEQRGAEAEQAVRPLAAARGMPPHERGVALSLLGDALDLQDRPAEAFKAYAAANRSLEEAHQGAFAAAGAERGSDLARRLAGYFDTAGTWAATEAPAAPLRQAFVVGFARTGTTLLGQVLAAHPEVVTLDEQELLSVTGQSLMSGAEALDRLAGLSRDGAEPFRREYRRRAEALAPGLGDRLLIDKLPMNVLGLPLISRLFPEAGVVLMRRDPRDVVFSCFRRQFVISGSSWEFLDLERAARFYDQVMRLAQLYAEKLPLRLHVQRYEDLVADFEGQTRALCGFLGLAWTADLNDFRSARQALDVATPSAVQVRRGLYREGVGQWRRYRAELEPVLPLLEPWAERFGYDPA